mmetsp:Transcript_46999/g.130931  ORF Transcript_46999/g.130931 Transcript_46999/m.130931 type:complete len:207 (+) Transcript_46999:1286-1906(+)
MTTIRRTTRSRRWHSSCRWRVSSMATILGSRGTSRISPSCPPARRCLRRRSHCRPLGLLRRVLPTGRQACLCHRFPWGCHRRLACQVCRPASLGCRLMECRRRVCRPSCPCHPACRASRRCRVRRRGQAGLARWGPRCILEAAATPRPSRPNRRETSMQFLAAVPTPTTTTTTPATSRISTPTTFDASVLRSHPLTPEEGEADWRL